MKVSAIVSAYFAEQFIDEKLRDLMNQSIKPEIVVICQANSKEYRAATIAKANYKPIEIVTTKDIPTVYAAWNFGIRASSGEYITNSNTDDRLYPKALERMAQELDEHPEAALVYAPVDIREGENIVGRYDWHEGDLDILVNVGCFIGPMPMWRRSLHDKYGWFDGDLTSAGDYEYWMRIAQGGEVLHKIPEALGLYHKRKDSLEHRNKLRSLWEVSRVRAIYRGQFDMWQKPYGA